MFKDIHHLEVVRDVVTCLGTLIEVQQIGVYGGTGQDVKLSHGHQQVVEEHCVRGESHIEQRHVNDKLNDIEHSPKQLE